jgi:hypothetical protein
MRFLRHLGAAVMVVGIVMLAGLAWNHFWPSSLVGQLASGGEQALMRGGHPVPGEHLAGPPTRAGHLPPGPQAVKLVGGRVLRIRNRPGVGAFYGLLKRPNLQVLGETAKAEAAFIAVVVIIDVIRRRLRRARRARDGSSRLDRALRDRC